MTTATQLDMEKVQALAMKAIGDFTACDLGTLHVVGDRLGLFKTLADAGSVTSAEFAQRAGIQERYAREWLSAMACAHYLDYDDATKRFTLSPEQAFVLTNPDSPVYLGSMFSMVPAVWKNIDALTQAFQQGGGVPQANYGADFWCAFERFTRPAFKNNLCQDWIASMPEVDARLRAGGSVADVGCGNGQSLLFLAQGYPDATLIGLDNYAPAIEAANANARAAGLAERVRYEVCDVTKGLPATYDLITSFDVVHDMPHPRAALHQIRQALKPDGTYFVVEFNTFGDLQRNIDHPLGLGTFGYAASVNYCMTTALAVGGDGTGTCMGEEKLHAFAKDAGFTQLRRLEFPQNPFNTFYELKA
jgi:2-polyprenyl-3-methyl-5-hydroxy-6-metoxy-1,4-benzoquinol methylase